MASVITASPRAEPLWRPAHRLNRSGIPDRFLPWLLDPASLTERVVAHCRQSFRVQLIDQRLARPMRNEAMALGIRFGTRTVIRRVQLMCGDTPWVAARTVIPPCTLTGKFRRFRHLGSRSLGAMLFADPTMERGEVEITCLTPADPLFHQAAHDLRDKPGEIWGRRSLFRLGGKPLLVCEFFLPAIADF